MTASNQGPGVPACGDGIPSKVQESLKRCRGIADLSDMPKSAEPPGEASISFSPEHAGLIHALNIPRDCSAAFLFWFTPVTARYLQDSGGEVRVFDTRARYRQATSCLCGPDVLHRSPLNGTVVAGSSPASEFLPDVLFLDAEQLCAQSIEEGWRELISQVLSNGGLVVNSRTSNSSMTLSQLLDDFTTPEETFVAESILTFPSRSAPALLVREGFLYESPNAWRHIAGYINEEGHERNPWSVPVEMVWSNFERYGEFPISSTSSFEVLYSRSHAADFRLRMDFVYQGIGTRHPEYWTITEKRRGDKTVARDTVRNSYRLQENERGLKDHGFSHILGKELYLTSQTLSQMWLEALGRGDTSAFAESLKDFREFLEEVPTRRDVRPFDLIPDNLVIDQGKIFPIDQEWYCSPQLINSEAIFVRGVIYFLARNAARLDTLVTSRRWGTRHRDFLNFACATVEIDPRSALEQLDFF